MPHFRAPSSCPIFVRLGEHTLSLSMGLRSDRTLTPPSSFSADPNTRHSINSCGGVVADGLAIFDALKCHPAAVTVEIDGVAFSIASLIAMAGDTVRMAEKALLMIHAPLGMASATPRSCAATPTCWTSTPRPWLTPTPATA